jgi:hypothetical protein
VALTRGTSAGPDAKWLDAIESAARAFTAGNGPAKFQRTRRLGTSTGKGDTRTLRTLQKPATAMPHAITAKVVRIAVPEGIVYFEEVLGFIFNTAGGRLLAEPNRIAVGPSWRGHQKRK